MSASITVGIPFFSGTVPDQFTAAVDSILAQSRCPDAIHLIQDGPVPPVLDRLVQDYLVRSPIIQHIVIEQNAGLAHALNVSILASHSQYYARMDSDDIAYPERLEKQVAFLEAHLEIDILGTWAVEFEADPQTEPGFLRKLPTESAEMRKVFHYRNPLIHPSVVFRRSVFAKIGLYNSTFLDEDLELWSRAFAAGVSSANLPEPLLFYRFVGSIQRRSSRILYHAKARYQFNTWSPKLNLLKVLSLLLRAMPYPIQQWAYSHLRS
jgi:glycosyltransferase involved in cell wall biosynthesis